MSEPMIPIGNRQLASVAEATAEQLSNFLKWYDANKGTPAVLKFEAASYLARSRLLTLQATPAPPAVQATPEPPPAAESTSIVMDPQDQRLSQLHDIDAVTARLAAYSEQYNLVSPATHVDAIPVGFGVSVSMVFVNSHPHGGEVYRVDGGLLALSSAKLQDIANAAGVSWDHQASGRLDDGSDPHFCHFRAVGYAKDFDGTLRQIFGHHQTDLRADSENVLKGGKGGKPMSDGDVQAKRRHILTQTETKARSRAIAKGLGLRRAYPPQDLNKPFAIARLIFTGKAEDPALARELALLAAKAAISAGAALYGSKPKKKNDEEFEA